MRQPPADLVTSRDVLPYAITPILAGCLGWQGFGHCKCLGRRDWDKLRALSASRRCLTQEIIDAVIQL